MKSFVIRNLLSNEEVLDLMALKGDKWERASSIGENSEPTYDGARITESSGIHYISTQSIGAKIIKKANELFDTKLYINESISILKYDERLRAKFDWHKDVIDYTTFWNAEGKLITDPESFYKRNSMPGRKVSITVAMNDRSSYNGGTFKIQSDDSTHERNSRVVDLNTGDAVLFDSNMYHGVEPVTRGIRYSAIFWLYDLEKLYEHWDDIEVEPSEGFDQFKRYYEKFDIPL